MKDVKKLVLSLGAALTAAPAVFALEANQFQLAHKLGGESRVFLMSEGKSVIRLITELRAEDLKSRKTGIEPISSIDFRLNSTGEIEFFAIHRFDDSKVFEVRKDEKSMKFVKKDAESALYSGSMSSYRGNTMATKEALKVLFESGDSIIQKDNLKILSTLKIPNLKKFTEVDFVASRDDFLDLLDADVTAEISQDSKAQESKTQNLAASPNAQPDAAEAKVSEAISAPTSAEPAAATEDEALTTAEKPSSSSEDPSADFDQAVTPAPAIESAEAESQSIN